MDRVVISPAGKKWRATVNGGTLIHRGGWEGRERLWRNPDDAEKWVRGKLLTGTGMLPQVERQECGTQ